MSYDNWHMIQQGIVPWYKYDVAHKTVIKTEQIRIILPIQNQMQF